MDFQRSFAMVPHYVRTPSDALGSVVFKKLFFCVKSSCVKSSCQVRNRGLLGALTLAAGVATYTMADGQADLEEAKSESSNDNLTSKSFLSMFREDPKVVVFGGNSNPELAQKVADYMGVKLGKIKVGATQSACLEIK